MLVYFCDASGLSSDTEGNTGMELMNKKSKNTRFLGKTAVWPMQKHQEACCVSGIGSLRCEYGSLLCYIAASVKCYLS